MLIHTVSPGETLKSIADLYGVSEFSLAFDNNVSALPSLPAGMALAVVLPLATHTVSPGETLYSIASRYSNDPVALWRDNMFLDGGDSLPPGEVLYIGTRREPLGAFRTGGYAYPFIPSELLRRSLPFCSALMPFTYGFTRSGGLIPPDDGFAVSACADYGTMPVMHLSTLDENDVFSVPLAEELLNSPDLQTRLLDSVIANMRAKGYNALDVDFEFLGASNAKKYADFIGYCASRLHPLGYGVMTALAPKTSDGQLGSLYEGHDYALLGAAADALLLMTYEWGYTYGPPMAVSPITPVGAVVDYALTRIPAEKLLLGISTYGYNFVLPYERGVSRADSVSTSAAINLAYLRGAEIFYDPTAMAPYFDYTESGVSHRVWFEDVRSISARISLMAQKGLSGMLIWSLNREGNQNLAAVNGMIDVRPFDIYP